MSKYIIADGHTASGNAGCGAVDQLDESNCTREVGPLVCKYLEQEGETAIHSRIDTSNSYNFEDCYVRSNLANKIGADWYIEIHFNSGKEHTGDGAEVCVGRGSTGEKVEMASRISSSIANALGIEDRGVKEEGLIVLSRTNMRALLVECMFVDSNAPTKYDPAIIARAIVEGILAISINDEWKEGWNSKSGRWWYSPDPVSKTYYKSEWNLIDNKWYLFDSNGWCITGWVYYQTCKDKKDVWYYLDSSNCDMTIGWKKIDGKWYYFNSSGEMQTGWIKDNGKDYCLYSSGAMIYNCDMYGYRFDRNGIATKIQ
ncbi:hypothetical protein psyc5s11_44770 [Clostridium gelidum]|uniref:MurNAc-LAA domain-containing protein n=1 Tax=Clostridium gelidum TaxID=704125 RepID=A0ABN6J4H7_9CLOT|nr:N-acetylmuramoyl-L-alanine amidase [Clostridium gelidum]BCZ48410.1 hypothetical protein psyc5s11_44770 [Clostridium gelidum]